jgi:hypothetical protein
MSPEHRRSCPNHPRKCGTARLFSRRGPERQSTRPRNPNRAGLRPEGSDPGPRSGQRRTPMPMPMRPEWGAPVTSARSARRPMGADRAVIAGDDLAGRMEPPTLDRGKVNDLVVAMDGAAAASWRCLDGYLRSTLGGRNTSSRPWSAHLRKCSRPTMRKPAVAIPRASLVCSPEVMRERSSPSSAEIRHSTVGQNREGVHTRRRRAACPLGRGGGSAGHGPVRVCGRSHHGSVSRGHRCRPDKVVRSGQR